jgi:hypothetical protein
MSGALFLFQVVWGALSPLQVWGALFLFRLLARQRLSPLIRQADPFKLPPIADTKSFLNLSNIINYYLRRPEFLTQRADGQLIMDSRNAEASCFWEGQIPVLLSKRVHWVSSLKTKDRSSMGKVLKCWRISTSIAALTRSQMRSLPLCLSSMTR